jgi:hypothetical protein
VLAGLSSKRLRSLSSAGVMVGAVLVFSSADLSDTHHACAQVEHLLDSAADDQHTGLALLEASRVVFAFAAKWATADITPKWALRAGDSVSLHLPLHRTAAAFAAAVAACDQRVAAAAASPSLLQQLLSGAGSSHAVTLGEHWIRALAFMSQVRWFAPRLRPSGPKQTLTVWVRSVGSNACDAVHYCGPWLKSPHILSGRCGAGTRSHVASEW